MIIDPNQRRQERIAKGQSPDPDLNENKTKRVETECTIPGVVVGWEHYRSAAKGTPGLLVRFVAVEGPEAGGIVETTFWLTDNAMGRLADFLLALGNTEPVNVHDDDDLERAFSANPVMIEVKAETYNDRNGNPRTRYDAAWFGRFTGKTSSAWNDLVAEAHKGWARYVSWRQNNPRPEPGSGVSAGSQGGGSGGNYYDDTVPF